MHRTSIERIATRYWPVSRRDQKGGPGAMKKRPAKPIEDKKHRAPREQETIFSHSIGVQINCCNRKVGGSQWRHFALRSNSPTSRAWIGGSTTVAPAKS